MEKLTFIKKGKYITFFAVLLLGLAVSVYLVQKQQIFKPKASTSVSLKQAFEVKDESGNTITCTDSASGVSCPTSANTVNIRFTPGRLSIRSFESQGIRGEPETDVSATPTPVPSSPTESPAVSPIPTPSESSTQSTPAPTAVPVSNSSNVSPTCIVTGTNLSGICGKSDSAHTTAGDWNCSLATDYGVGYANCTTEYPNCYVGCTRD